MQKVSQQRNALESLRSLVKWFHCSTHCTDSSSLALTTNCELMIAMKTRSACFQKERINCRYLSTIVIRVFAISMKKFQFSADKPLLEVFNIKFFAFKSSFFDMDKTVICNSKLRPYFKQSAKEYHEQVPQVKG